MSIEIGLYSGYVLAGGKSSRMGRDKGLMEFDGKKMIEYSIKALQPICSSIRILANDPMYDKLGYPMTSDFILDKGPLAGICTGLILSHTNLNFFAPCDSPYINQHLFEHLLKHANGYDAIIPIYKGKLYPLTAIYSKNCLSAFMRSLKNNQLKVMEAIESVNTKKVELGEELPFFNENTLANINTIKELNRYAN